jgi:hypothetical protein
MNSVNAQRREPPLSLRSEWWPLLSPIVSRVIFALVSIVGVLVGLEYNSIRSDALATAHEVAALHQKMARTDAYESTAAEHARHDDELLAEMERRLETIDGRLTTIGEEVAVLADRAARSDSARSARVHRPTEVMPDPPSPPR